MMRISASSEEGWAPGEVASLVQRPAAMRWPASAPLVAAPVRESRRENDDGDEAAAASAFGATTVVSSAAQQDVHWQERWASRRHPCRMADWVMCRTSCGRTGRADAARISRRANIVIGRRLHMTSQQVRARRAFSRCLSCARLARFGGFGSHAAPGTAAALCLWAVGGARARASASALSLCARACRRRCSLTGRRGQVRPESEPSSAPAFCPAPRARGEGAH
jgi:hypothetical protein